jgi:hypothetical protein
MTKQNGSGNPEENEKENEMNFEFIDESEIESVKRGRKPKIDSEMVAFFNSAKVGQLIKVTKLGIDSAILSAIQKETDKVKIAELMAEMKRQKATNSAMIRAQARLANWNKVSVRWDKNGIPYAKRES